MVCTQWIRARLVVCATASYLMVANHVWGQSSPLPLLTVPISPTVSPSVLPTATGQFVNRVFRAEKGEHKYVVFVPAGYSHAKRAPVILYLHGAASRGTDGRAQLVSGLAPAIKLRAATFPFLVVFPQCENTHSRLLGGWTDDPKGADRLLKILDVVEQDYPTSELRCEAEFAPGYEPQTPGIDVQRFVSQVMLGRDGAQTKEGNKPVQMQDVSLDGVPFRMEEFTWSEGCLTLRAKISAIVVTNDTDKPMTFETRGPFSDWSPPRTLAPGEHNEFKVPSPLTWRHRLPTTTLFYTLPIGREASVRNAPTPSVVLVRDEIDLDNLADAPRSAHLEVSSPITQ